ncbi:MAG: ATP-dependent helicase, partial [Nitrococcus mobilis]|nr:ATP-dependent helicase [Nitrococcus mobilis]
MSLPGRADPHQREAILLYGHGLVSACPGAGKTRVLALRSAHLLATHRRGRVVAVTFTRDAAKGLRARILAEAGAEHARRCASGTFHGLALNQLKRQHGKGSLRVLSAREQRMMLAQAWERAASEAEFTFERFDHASAAIEAIKACIDPAPSPQASAAGALYAIYQRLLERSGSHDFADLMLRAVAEMDSGALDPIGARWMLVDEAQDMDEVQYAWILAHARAGVEIMCVADDDQSIYQWRHALGYRGLMRFREATEARHVSLPTNYRCRPEVLEPAVRLIGHNRNRVGKDICAHREPGGAVAVIVNETRWDESTQLARHLLDADPDGWTVLARTNRLLDCVELALASQDIACRRIGGEGFWEKPAAQAYLGLMRSVCDDDAVALLQAL